MRLSPVSRRMVVVIGIAAFSLILVGTIVYLAVASLASIEALYFAFGVILTSALNVGKVFLLERTAYKISEMDDPNAGSNYIRLQYLLRFLLTGLVLLAAGLVFMYVDPPFISIWGAIAGIFTLNISAISTKSLKLDEE